MPRTLTIAISTLLLAGVTGLPADGRADDRPLPADASPSPALRAAGLKSGSAAALALQLEGAKLVSAHGDIVGTVEKVIDRPGAGRVAVLAVGGLLGIGERRVVVPAESLVPSGAGAVRTDLTREQLDSLPAYGE